jgi:hypothetical protein
VDTPISFQHGLDLDLFAWDRLEDLRRRAPAGLFRIQDADPGFERDEQPAAIDTSEPLEKLARGERKIHAYFHDITSFAPEYAAARDQVMDAAGEDRHQPLYHLVTNIRVFSPEGPVALHGDGESQLNCGVGGRNVWHFSTPSGLSQEEHENLLRGGQFLKWRELPVWKSFDLGPGDGCGAPPRWPHWIEHPGPEPAVSFEVGYFTADDVRERKVYEVNWLLRKARLSPTAPNANPRKDARKRKAFDAISRVTRKGAEFRGV